MGIFKVRLRATDRLWTQYIRKRDNYTCQACGRVYTPDNCANLGVSHFYSRRHEGTRFDDDNCMALCNIPCHQEWGHGEERNGYREFMIGKLGQHGFDLLTVRAHTYKKRDDEMDLIVIKELLRQLEEPHES